VDDRVCVPESAHTGRVARTAGGKVVAFLRGEHGVYQRVDRTEQTVRFLSFSTSCEPDIVIYPDYCPACSKPNSSAVGFSLDMDEDGWLDAPICSTTAGWRPALCGVSNPNSEIPAAGRLAAVVLPRRCLGCSLPHRRRSAARWPDLADAPSTVADEVDASGDLASGGWLAETCT
jgi:hypothetical protein